MVVDERLCFIDISSCLIRCNEGIHVEEIQNEILSRHGILAEEYYLIRNGKKLDNTAVVDGIVHIIPRLLGGKGGFGSMLRAIGAQIEKTTNREACRDLSGRRLRDINEEQRLKNWIAQQADRERENAERKKKKLENLCREPKHDFKDETYEKERSELTEKVSSSVEEGFKKATCSGTSSKRPHVTGCEQVKKKKKKLWIDADDLSSSDTSDSDTECNKIVTNVVSKTDVEGPVQSK